MQFYHWHCRAWSMVVLQCFLMLMLPSTMILTFYMAGLMPTILSSFTSVWSLCRR